MTSATPREWPTSRGSPVAGSGVKNDGVKKKVRALTMKVKNPGLQTTLMLVVGTEWH